MLSFKKENLENPSSIYMPWWKEVSDQGIRYALYDNDTCRVLGKCIREGIRDVKPIGERIHYQIV